MAPAPQGLIETRLDAARFVHPLHCPTVPHQARAPGSRTMATVPPGPSHVAAAPLFWRQRRLLLLKTCGCRYRALAGLRDLLREGRRQVLSVRLPEILLPGRRGHRVRGHEVRPRPCGAVHPIAVATGATGAAPVSTGAAFSSTSAPSSPIGAACLPAISASSASNFSCAVDATDAAGPSIPSSRPPATQAAVPSQHGVCRHNGCPHQRGRAEPTQDVR